MPQLHIVKQGECFSSIAKKYGFLEKTLWEHPLNGELKNKRQNPNVLFPGDEINIPDHDLKEHTGATETQHKFRLIRDKIEFSLQVLNNDEPVANEEYVLTVDGENIKDVTDGEGWVRQPIEAMAKKGKLVIAGADLEFDLRFGYLDPVEEKSGAMSRLRNLGHYFGENENNNDCLLEAALRGFQKKYNLPETGENDAATQSKLKEVHGS